MSKKKNESTSKQPTIQNRRARYDYQLLETFRAGITLTGSEVKSLRDGKASLADAYCLFVKGELYLRGAQISEYTQASYNNHEPKRDRKLLLTKQELKKLKSKGEEKGLTIVPLKLYFNARNVAKCDIALAQGKKTHDKRDSIKERDVKRDLQRMKL